MKKVLGNKESASKILAITGANVIDMQNRIIHENYTILCNEGKIIEIGISSSISIPNDAKIIKLSGEFVIPGLIDTHVHLAAPGVDDYKIHSLRTMKKRYERNAYLTLKSGVTTIRNMPGYTNGKREFRDRVDKGEMISPRILECGSALSAPYGYFSLKRFISAPPSLVKIISVLYGIQELSIDVDNSQEVKDAIAILKNSGVDFIKTVTPGSEYVGAEMREYCIKRKVNPQVIDAGMKFEVLQSIVENAHAQGLKVSAHSINLPDGFKQAIDAGVDSIEHPPFGLLDAESFNLMSEKGICWVPTVFFFTNTKKLIDNPELFDEEEIRNAITEPYHSRGKKSLYKKNEMLMSGTDPILLYFFDVVDKLVQSNFLVNFENAIKSGVKIVAGTDGGVGYLPHGFLYKEIEMFVSYGMDEFEAIKTATINAAELLGLEKEIGSIELGKVADLVIVRANPIENIENIRQVEFVIKDGIVVYDNMREG